MEITTRYLVAWRQRCRAVDTTAAKHIARQTTQVSHLRSRRRSLADSAESSSDKCFVTRANSVNRPVADCRAKYAMCLRSCVQLGGNSCIVRQQLVVTSLCTEAARIVLVEDLQGGPLSLEPRQ
eukprot:COSAG02_NODE_29564_length_567_cov_0.551282_1_plen_123_part_10